MKLLIVGCGSIGKRHAGNIRKINPSIELFATDYLSDRTIPLVEAYNIIPYDMLSRHIPFDAFIICVPTPDHMAYIKRAIENEANVFVEKPLSDSLNGVSEALTMVSDKSLIMQVGYQLRFHPGLQLVKKLLDENRIGKVLSIRAEFGQYLPDWRPIDYTEHWGTWEQMGGGIISEASHEIDYVRWLSGGEVTHVSCFAGHISSLEGNADDTAEIILKFDNNVISGIHVDMTQRLYARKCKLVGEEGGITWEYPSPTINFYTTKKENQISLPRDKYWDTNNMYIAEMKHFIACLESKEKPVVDGETGKRVLEIILAAKQSSNENKVMEV